MTVSIMKASLPSCRHAEKHKNQELSFIDSPVGSLLLRGCLALAFGSLAAGPLAGLTTAFRRVFLQQAYNRLCKAAL